MLTIIFTHLYLIQFLLWMFLSFIFFFCFIISWVIYSSYLTRTRKFEFWNWSFLIFRRRTAGRRLWRREWRGPSTGRGRRRVWRRRWRRRHRVDRVARFPQAENGPKEGSPTGNHSGETADRQKPSTTVERSQQARGRRCRSHRPVISSEDDRRSARPQERVSGCEERRRKNCHLDLHQIGDGGS